MDNLGDLLLTFGRGTRGLPARVDGQPWRAQIERPYWTLSTTLAGAGWAGMPCEAVQAGRLCWWVLGDLYGISAHDLLAELAVDPRAAVKINGHALLLAWDEAAGQWHIWTDRFGTLHAYLTRGALGTFSPAVAAASPTRSLDWTGLAGFFTNGFFPADRTHYQQVRILPPATHTVLDARGGLVSQARYWNWQHEPDAARSFSESVDAFAQVFHRVIEEKTRSRAVAFPISGGLDSRSTVAALTDEQSRERVWSFSYGYGKGSPETAIARQIAHARGLAFEAFTIPPYLFDQIHGVTAAVEGFQDITQCRQVAVAGEIGQHAGRVMAAHWGDVWFDQAGADGIHPVEQLALKKFAKPGAGWLLERLVAPNMPTAARQAEELIITTAGQYSGIADQDFRLKAIKTDLWSSRWTTASLRAYQIGAFPITPFYDTRIADFFSTVPSAYLTGRELQIEYLKRHAPDLARITWQAYDANLHRYQHANTWLLPRRALKKALRLLTGATLPQRNWEVQFHNPAGRAGLEQWLSRPGLRLHDFLPPSSARELLDRLSEQPHEREVGYAVSMLLTFSAWLEQYA